VQQSQGGATVLPLAEIAHERHEQLLQHLDGIAPAVLQQIRDLDLAKQLLDAVQEGRGESDEEKPFAAVAQERQDEMLQRLDSIGQAVLQRIQEMDLAKQLHDAVRDGREHAEEKQPLAAVAQERHEEMLQRLDIIGSAVLQRIQDMDLAKQLRDALQEGRDNAEEKQPLAAVAQECHEEMLRRLDSIAPAVLREIRELDLRQQQLLAAVAQERHEEMLRHLEGIAPAVLQHIQDMDLARQPCDAASEADGNAQQQPPPAAVQDLHEQMLQHS
jgi:uncharacterized protein YllA (UPF0747 family)